MEATAEITAAVKNVPALRFPEFEGEWVKKKLKDIFTINAGGDVPKENVSEQKTDKFKYPIYANAEKDKGFYAYSDIYKVDKDVVTVAGRGVNVGIAHARNHKFYPIVRLLVLTPKSNQNIYFFEYAINRLNILVESTGVPQLTAPQLSSYKVAYPIASEQQKIASFLSIVDDKIQQLSKKKALLEKYKKGVMQQIFSQQIRFKDDNGNDYPEWEEKKLGDLFEFYTTNSYSRSLLNYDEGSVKNIHYGDIHTQFKSNFDITQEKVPYINEDVDTSRIAESSYCRVGDLIIADASEDYKDIGKAIEIINLNNETIVAGLHTYIARDNYNTFALGFKGYLMQTQKVRQQMMRFATGVSVLGISKGNIAKVEIGLPIVEEQQKIVNFLTSIDNKINYTSKQLEQAQQFKKGLLQQLFV